MVYDFPGPGLYYGWSLTSMVYDFTGPGLYYFWSLTSIVYDFTGPGLYYFLVSNKDGLWLYGSGALLFLVFKSAVYDFTVPGLYHPGPVTSRVYITGPKLYRAAYTIHQDDQSHTGVLLEE